MFNTRHFSRLLGFALMIAVVFSVVGIGIQVMLGQPEIKYVEIKGLDCAAQPGSHFVPITEGGVYVTIVDGEYLYYDSGDHYHWNGSFEPGIYYVCKETAYHVVSTWGTNLGTQTMNLKDGKVVTVTVSASGFFYGRRPELEAFWQEHSAELTTIAADETFAAIAKLNSKNLTVPMDAAQKALYDKYQNRVLLNSMSASYSAPK